MTQIRNIIQSAPSREIIKTAPDMVVYIDGLPFFINPYLKDESNNYTTVNFNDYVTAIATNYGVDNLIPSGSINLSVPNGSKQLFMAPGGGLLIDTMSEVRIYAKSYFFSPTGNTVYRRIFNGMIKSVDYNENNTSLEIAISVVGILHLMELMQTDRAPATMSNSSESQTPMQTVDSNKNAYQVIVATFRRAMDYSGFLKTAIGTKEEKIKDSALAASLKANFIAKWQERLTDLRKYVHLFGYKETVAQPDSVDAKSQDVKNTKDTTKASGAEASSVESQANNYLTNSIRRHLPEFALGSIQLFQGKIMPRLEIVRAAIESIGYEGYQDVDGSIIIKPPLYNLDSTIIGDTSKIKDENLSEYSNPFIIHLSEVLGENYMEDESAIRRTRMTVQGGFNPAGWQMGMANSLKAVGSFIDVNLVRKFGVRDEAPRQLNFLSHNSKAIFAFAAMELVKLNKNFRTYHVTIPLRPEMRLGFPIFIPHLDMYAYVSGIGVSYNVGGRADMSLTCNFIRKRPQFPTYQKTEKGEPIIVYASQPNLVHKWTKSGGSTVFNSDQMKADQLGLLVTGSPATIHNPFKPSDEQNAIDSYVKKKLGNLFETHTDSKDMNWTVQKDDEKFFGDEFDIDNISTERPAGKKVVSNNGVYIDKLTSAQPFTDEKGYEVMTPFAWGRYSSVSEAIYEFTRGGTIEDTRGIETKTAESKALLKTSSAFLYAGMATPVLAPTSASQLRTVTEKTGGDAAKIVDELQLFDRSNVISFEMDFTGGNRLNNDSTQLQAMADSADFSNVVDVTPPPVSPTSDQSALQRAESFLAGTQDYLKSVLNEGSNSNSDVSLLPQNTDLGTYATPGSISSSLSKLQATWVNQGKGTVE
jgi:hypothetical protein